MAASGPIFFYLHLFLCFCWFSLDFRCPMLWDLCNCAKQKVSYNIPKTCRVLKHVQMSDSLGLHRGWARMPSRAIVWEMWARDIWNPSKFPPQNSFGDGVLQ